MRLIAVFFYATPYVLDMGGAFGFGQLSKSKGFRPLSNSKFRIVQAGAGADLARHLDPDMRMKLTG